MQRDIIGIPKSSNVDRMKENFDIFDFALSQNEMDEIKKLDRGYNVSGFNHYDPKMIELLETF